MSSLHEFLGATIGVMSPAALATLFLEMNFIEGIIPDCLKTERFDNKINDCYELLLTQLLRLVQNKMPSQKTEFGKVRERGAAFIVRVACSLQHPRGGTFTFIDLGALCTGESHAVTILQAIAEVDLSGADPLGSLHSCLEAYAFKVLPAHAQRANLHFDCFKALATEKGGDKKVRASGMFSWQASQKPRRRARQRSSAPGQKQGAAQASLESLVSGMTGKLEAIFVAEDD